MTKRIGLVAFPGFQALDLAALTVFEFANHVKGEAVYAFAALSVEGNPVRSTTGIEVATHPIGWGGYDTLLIAGTTGEPAPQPLLERTLREAASATRRIASICTGAFILANTGLLDGRRATTHWAWGRRLQALHPGIRVDEDKIFVRDGNLWTSAGVTACIDLSLALVEADLGAEVAKRVARLMVVYHRRGGGQSQFSALAELEPESDRVRNALRYARDNLHRDLDVDDLAAHVNWSPRHFSRVFRAQTGLAPAKAIEKLRVEAAQSLIDRGNTSIAQIAALTGFGDEERLRRAFLRAFGQPPKVFVRAARSREGMADLT